MNLADKLSQNHQRRILDSLAEKLPSEIGSLIKIDKYKYKEAVYAGHGLAIFPQGIDGEYVYPEGYSKYIHKEVDQLNYLSKYIETLNVHFET